MHKTGRTYKGKFSTFSTITGQRRKSAY